MKIMTICSSLLLALIFGMCQARAQTGAFERTLQVTGPVSMEVTSGSGHIFVHAGGSGSVHIDAKIQARNSWICWLGSNAADEVRKIEAHPPIEQQGNSIRVGQADDRLTPCGVSIDYDLTVPPDTGLESHSGSGDESIDGLTLASSADAGSGNITVTNVSGDIRLHSGSGDLNVRSDKAALYAHTGSGRIRATDVAGEIVATTASGSVDIERPGAGSVTIHTASGTVDLRGIQGKLGLETASGRIHVEGEPKADWQIGTASGSIDLKTPSQGSFDFDAKSVSGTLKVDHPLTVQGVVSRRHLQGKVGNGGALLEARTISGDIEID